MYTARSPRRAEVVRTVPGFMQLKQQQRVIIFLSSISFYRFGSALIAATGLWPYLNSAFCHCQQVFARFFQFYKTFTIRFLVGLDCQRWIFSPIIVDIHSAACAFLRDIWKGFLRHARLIAPSMETGHKTAGRQHSRTTTGRRNRKRNALAC